MTTTQLIIVCAAAIVIVVVVTGHRLTVSFRGVQVTTERIQTAVGAPNGQGDAMSQLAVLDSKITEVHDELEERTHILRAGRTETEELGPYIQSRLHDVIGAQTLISLKVDFIWRAAKSQGWDLPDLPSMQQPEPGG